MMMDSTMSDTNRIDYEDPRANMFGILSCSKCGDTGRWPTQATNKEHPNSIVCDNCGFVEPYGWEVDQ